MATNNAPSEKLGIIYSITNKTSGKRYIGQTSLGLERRWRCHCNQAKRSASTPLHRAITKYGVDDFKLEVLITCPICYLNAAEQFCIKSLNSQVADGGYNILPGGEFELRGREFSDEHRRKLSEAATGRKLSPEHIQKTRAGNLGKKLSAEHQQRLVEANRGRKMPEDQKRRLREANLGKKLSEETRRKIGDASRGRKMSEKEKLWLLEANLGKHRSEDTKRKISEARLGMKFSDEHRRSLKEAWVRRKAKAAAQASTASPDATATHPPAPSPGHPAFQESSPFGPADHALC